MSPREILDFFLKFLEDKLDDYHCLVLPSFEIDDFELQVFRAEDSKEIDIEKLKEEVREFIKSNQNEDNRITSP